MTNDKKINLLGLTYHDFLTHFRQISGRGDYFTKPVYQHIMKKGEFDIENLEVFAKSPIFLQKIKQNYHADNLSYIKSFINGNTEKIAFQTTDKLIIETVIIPMKTYKTLCISSQIGCKMGCTFCKTKDLGFKRDLLAEEIVSQVFYIKHIKKEPIRNIVFMGMGEPLDNWQEVSKSIDILTDDFGFNFKRTHITVSTCGLCDQINTISKMDKTFFFLAVSLNTCNEQTRNHIMPINKKFNLKTLKNTLINYQNKNKRDILIEYVLIKGINDSLKDAEELIQFCQGLKVKINLIIYNAGPDDLMQPPDYEICESFFHYLLENNMLTLNRISKGSDIMAACGQLAGQYRVDKKD